MAGRKIFIAWTAIGTLLALVVPVAGAAVAGLLFPRLLWTHLPLHSLVEAAGGLTALAIGGILLMELGHKSNARHYRFMITGLASMGVLDLFHAASTPGNGFVWLHSAATFAGGVAFGSVWVCQRLRPLLSRKLFLTGILSLSGMAGCLSLIIPGLLPAMQTPDGAFSASAMFLNFTGGIGFLCASAYFVHRFSATGDGEDWLFAVQTALFGAAGILFRYSILWDAGWWWWHLLRLAASIAALTYGLRVFGNAEKELRKVNRKLSDSNTQLDRLIERRTASLRASEERFELAVRGSTDGLWDWNVITSEVYYSPRMKELIGYTDDEFPNVFASFETRLHPDDHDWVLREIQAHLEHRKPYDVEYRLLTKSGEYRWFRGAARRSGMRPAQQTAWQARSPM